MFSSLSRLFKHSGIYAVGSSISTGILFFLLPLYTRTLSPTEFGILETLSPSLGILSMVTTIGFTSAFLKTHERDTRTAEDRKTLLGTLLLILVPFSTAVTLLLWFFQEPLAIWLLNDATPQHTLLVRLVLGSNWLLLFYQIGLSVLRSKERSTWYATLMIGRAVFLFGLIAASLLLWNGRIEHVFWSMLVTNAALVLFVLPTLLKEVRLRASSRLAKALFSFGFAVFPAQIALWVMDLSDRFFLKEALSFEDVGYYSLSYRIASAVNILFIAPFQLAWPTYSFSIGEHKDAKHLYAKSLTVFVSVGALLALALSLYAGFFIRLLGTDAYRVALGVVPLVSLGYLVYGMHFVITTGIHLVEKSRLYPWFIVLPATLNIGLNALLIPRFGLLAASATTLVCFACVTALTYVVTQRHYPVPYEWKRIASIFCILLVVGAGGWMTLRAIESASFALLAELLLPLPFLALFSLFLLRLHKLSLRRLRSLLNTLRSSYL